MNQKGLPLRSFLAEGGQTQVLILAGIVLAIALAGGIFYLGRITLLRQDSTGQAAPKPQNVVTSSPQPSTTPTDASREPNGSAETANWKTYKDVNLGFELKHPLNAEVTSQKLYAMLSTASSDGISIAPPYQEPYDKWYSFDVVVRDNPQNQPAEAIIDSYTSEIEKDCSPPGCAVPQKVRNSLKEYRNGNVDGYIFHTGSHGDSVVVVQTKGNKLHIFRMTGDQGNISDYGLKLLDQILSTFRFD